MLSAAAVCLRRRRRVHRGRWVYLGQGATKEMGLRRGARGAGALGMATFGRGRGEGGVYMASKTNRYARRRRRTFVDSELVI